MRDIGLEVKKVKKRYGTLDPYQLAREMDIIIHRLPLGNTRGIYYCSRRIRSIILNEELSEWMERFVLAHEIGHLVMHPKHNAPFMRNTFFSTDRYETEANAFALHMLIPDEDLEEYPERTIGEWAAVIGMPVWLTELRFKYE